MAQRMIGNYFPLDWESHFRWCSNTKINLMRFHTLPLLSGCNPSIRMSMACMRLSRGARAQVRKRFNSATQLRFKAQEITFIKNKNAILPLSGLLKRGGLAGIININWGAWDLGSKLFAIIFKLRSTHSMSNTFIRRASDLQFVLDHVEGVIGEVDLLNALDDFLLRLRVNGLLPQLSQLLLQEGDSDPERETDSNKERERS